MVMAALTGPGIASIVQRRSITQRFGALKLENITRLPPNTTEAYVTT
jgi:hypothetical protein